LNYALVYSYSLNDKQINQVRQFCKSRNLRSVSASIYHDWCDKCLPVSPFEFLTLVRDADYVITSTYHGSIFSIICKKQFVVYGQGFVKISSLLEELGLSGRLINDDVRIETIIDLPIDYTRVDRVLADKRRDSLAYLVSAIEGREI
jgi:hypothetical protein